MEKKKGKKNSAFSDPHEGTGGEVTTTNSILDSGAVDDPTTDQADGEGQKEEEFLGHEEVTTINTIDIDGLDTSDDATDEIPVQDDNPPVENNDVSSEWPKTCPLCHEQVFPGKQHFCK